MMHIAVLTLLRYVRTEVARCVLMSGNVGRMPTIHLGAVMPGMHLFARNSAINSVTMTFAGITTIMVNVDTSANAQYVES